MPGIRFTFPKKDKPFGMELLLDCYDCDAPLVDDMEVVYRFLVKAVETLGVTVQAPPYVFHSPSVGPHGEDFSSKAGISAWVPLIESGIQCHTLTEKNFVSIDYYTCSEVNDEMKDKLIDLARRTFDSKFIESQFVLRGKEYYK